MEIKKVNEILELSSGRYGCIKHFVSLKEGRATFYKDAYMRETSHLTVNVAATLDEIESLAIVVNGLLKLMKEGLPQVKGWEKKKHPSGKRGYILTAPNGTEISILDFKDVMKTAPKQVKQVCYMGWEAWDGKETTRGKTYAEVEALVKKNYKD